MKRKSLLAALTVLLMFSVALVGCSGGSKETADGEKVLKVWAMGGEGQKLPELVKQYEQQNPGVKIDVQAIPWGNAHDKLMTAVASKSGPDVIQMGTSWIPEFANANALLDLTSYMEKYPNLKEENFFNGAVQTMKHDGKVVGIPWYVETRVLYYRTDLLAEAGYPEGPKTWDDLKDASKKLTARGEGKYGITIDGRDQITTALFGWQNGSDLINDQREPLFNQPEYVESIEYLKSFWKEGLVPQGLDLDLTAAFKDGTIPMFISGPWMIGTVKEKAPEIDGKWSTIVMPTKKTNTSSIGGSNLSVFSHTKMADEAVKFISYMSEKETQLKWYEMANTLPSVKEAWNDEKLKEPLVASFGKQLENSRPAPFIKEWETIAQAIIASFEQITVGDADVKTELDALNEKAKEILSK
ncbi:sugar ABC transporter substrate-binding protein [Paenibacillus assamensis]|uniref:sugar ABC transporter substrate-binding protein n=1 Tax=Paenibacillus assamensis TaxID=311244 RepID=UPI00048AE3E7|nr:sugar ABC transporter substrate-binding protein [Paenibacillus assamensis]